MVPQAKEVVRTCPLKINLCLSVLGRREDGFHALHSVVTTAAFGDTLRLQWDPNGRVPDQVLVNGAELPENDNTVSRALSLFRDRYTLESGCFTAHLEKRIPIGAGLGGGSSDASGTLLALRELFPNALPGEAWMEMAAGIGSDCPLFLAEGPVLMEGRGERITPLPADLAERLRGQPVILFKPAFSVPTLEAYRRLAATACYRPQKEALTDMQMWRDGDGLLPPAWNDFERLMDEWMPSLAVVLDRLRNRHGLDARMSGSGSACFVFAKNAADAKKRVVEELAFAWGKSFWIQETVLN